ncbi:Reticulon, partial [Cynara cardunculus var. scolymus]
MDPLNLGKAEAGVGTSWVKFLDIVVHTFVLLHSIPVVYEKYEDQIDAFAEKAMMEMKKRLVYYSILDQFATVLVLNLADILNVSFSIISFEFQSRSRKQVAGKSSPSFKFKEHLRKKTQDGMKQNINDFTSEGKRLL